MADKSVGELIAAQSVTPTDLFVLEQNGTAKKLTGQILENWLVSFADGHGGIQSIAKLSTSGLVDTYRITLADTTTFDFVVNNGRGITGISKTSTSGLVDTYTISYNNGTASKFTVKNGEKGKKGDNAYTWIKYASQQPTAASHSMGDIPDAWMGIYTGTLAAAPTDWTQYKWYRVRGDQGATGAPATLTGRSVTYMASDSGTVVPSGSWSSDVPTVTQGRYLWTRVVLTFNTGSPVTFYSVSRFGIDGSGAVSSVNGKGPDTTGNVRVNAEDITTTAGTSVEAALAQKQEQITASGLLKGTGDGGVANAEAGVDYQAPITAGAGVRISGSKISTAAAPRNLLDNSDFRNPVNQRGKTSYTGEYGIDRWRVWNSDRMTVNRGYITCNGNVFQYFLPDVLQNSVHTLVAKKTDGSILLYIKNPHEAYSVADNGLGLGLDTNVLVSMKTGSYLWAALYEGSYTAETLPEYQPKGYGAELAECKRYYQKFSRVGMLGITGEYVTGFAFGTEFRAVPAVNVTSLLDLPEWVERNVTNVTADSKGVQYIYSNNCKSVAHKVEGDATADL